MNIDGLEINTVIIYEGIAMQEIKDANDGVVMYGDVYEKGKKETLSDELINLAGKKVRVTIEIIA